jgi:hypothetical protein
MVKWNKIRGTWAYREPKFFSVCNMRHRFRVWRRENDPWWRDLEREAVCCAKCKVWWYKDTLKWF